MSEPIEDQRGPSRGRTRTHVQPQEAQMNQDRCPQLAVGR